MPLDLHAKRDSIRSREDFREGAELGINRNESIRLTFGKAAAKLFRIGSMWD